MRIKHLAAVVVLLAMLVDTDSEAQDLWLMKGHDVRRTGQSRNNGPTSIDPLQSWTAEAPAATVLNIGASVDDKGVYFGSWGLLRRDPLNPDPRFWDKSDGKVYGLDIQTGTSLWGDALDLDLVPRCYEYPDRGPNLLWCGFSPYEVSFYNGTVEGQAAIDTARNVMYVGRGDGRLFAIDPAAGAVKWRYVTYNPEQPDDPDGGGEVVSAPLVGPDGLVYFGTWGEGEYETHAFYAVNPDSTLAWRYPTNASLTHRIFASPALSPDGSTIYVSTFRDEGGNAPAALYAFNRLPLGAAPDETRLKWMIDLEHAGLPVQTSTIAVGSDGTVYVGGLIPQIFGVPVIAAFEDAGDHGALKWDPGYVEFRDGSQYVLGIALLETDGPTERIYVTTANLGTPLFNAKVEGELYAVDPENGVVLASYDPSDEVDAAVGSLNSPAIDASGTIYFGVRGRYGSNPINGYYFAVAYDEDSMSFSKVWHYEVDGYVEWNHPAIGPDGGIYAGSSVNLNTDEIRTSTYDDGVIPEGSTPLFYALKGPTTPVRSELPDELLHPFKIVATFPNPFSSRVAIQVEVARPGLLHLEVVDVLGRPVARLSDGFAPAGRHTFNWEAAAGGRAAGVYVLRARLIDATTGQEFATGRKLIYLAP